MRDALAWSFPFGRIFGVNIRVHLLFPVIFIALVLRAAYTKLPPDNTPLPGMWIDVAIILTLLFLSVILHELGHCFGARWMHGDAQNVLIWPLGGLAYVDVPHTPRANAITTAAGPAANLLLCVLSGLFLLVTWTEPIQPSWSPFYCPMRWRDQLVELRSWSGHTVQLSPYSATVILSWLFWVNWVSLLLNLLLPAFPLDAGRLLQCALWPRLGYAAATKVAVYSGFATAVVLGICSIAINEVMFLALALFIYAYCQHQWFVLETGGEDSLFGYDFSQGYTSLEREEEPRRAPPRPRQSWWQKWHQRRIARKLQREQERREADEQRMDELLEKISTQGIGALSEAEKRFMKQFSDRYRNK